MASVFDAFDWPHRIRVTTAETPRYNTEGVQVFPTTVTTVITGHVTIYSRSEAESEWRRGVAGVMEEGDVRLFTESLLKKGQLVLIDQTATNDEDVRTYRVMSEIRNHHLVARMSGGTHRREFLLKEVPASGPVIT